MRGIVVVLAALLCGCDKISELNPDEAIIRRCEGSVISRLKTPSTYKRISASAEQNKDFPLRKMQEYAKTIDAEPELKTILEHAAPTKAPFFTVFVQYDVKNLFGVPIRGTSICWLGTSSDREYAAENHILNIIADTDFLEMLADMRHDAMRRAGISQ